MQRIQGFLIIMSGVYIIFKKSISPPPFPLWKSYEKTCLVMFNFNFWNVRIYPTPAHLGGMWFCLLFGIIARRKFNLNYWKESVTWQEFFLEIHSNFHWTRLDLFIFPFLMNWFRFCTREQWQQPFKRWETKVLWCQK